MAENRDIAYYKALWEGDGASFEPAPAMWDERADAWQRQLQAGGEYAKQIEGRVAYLGDALRGRGLLAPGSTVVDIGCGPGRFVAEFAKTAGHSTGIDISPRMLAHAADHARELGLSNVTLEVCDFKTADIKAHGWEGQFDLVVTNITPALQNTEDLEKVMAMSRGFCLNGSFVRWWDELEERIGREVFGKPPKPHPLSDGQLFQAFFNLLWFSGYDPEVFYHKQRMEEDVGPDPDMCRYYAGIFAESKEEIERGAKEIEKFIRANASPDGTMRLRSQRYFGFVLWDVNDKVER